MGPSCSFTIQINREQEAYDMNSMPTFDEAEALSDFLEEEFKHVELSKLKNVIE